MSRVGDNLRFYRPFLPLFGGIFCCLLGVGASLAALPFYVLAELHGSTVAVGVVVAAIAASAVISRPIAGRLADRYGYKRLMLAGVGACVVAGALYLVASNAPAVVAVRIVHGFGEGAVYTAGAAWLVALAPAERRGRIVGLYGISMWSGITLGVLAGAALREVSGYPAVWLFCLVAPLAGAVLVLSKAAPEQVRSGARPALLPPAAVLPGAALSLAALGYAALSAFVALHLADRGISNGIAALNAFGFTYVGVRLFLGNLPDRLGAGRVAFWSALVEAVGLLIVAVAPNLVVAVLGGLVIGAGLSLLFPSLALLVINRADKAQQGAAIGAFTSFWDIGLVIGGPLAGFVAGTWNYPAVFYAMLVAAVASAAVALVESAQRRKAAPPPVEAAVT